MCALLLFARCEQRDVDTAARAGAGEPAVARARAQSPKPCAARGARSAPGRGARAGAGACGGVTRRESGARTCTSTCTCCAAFLRGPGDARTQPANANANANADGEGEGDGDGGEDERQQRQQERSKSRRPAASRCRVGCGARGGLDLETRAGRMVSMRRLIKLGDLAGVQRVVQRKPDLLDASVSSGGHTPLMWAIHSASGGQTAIAEWLLGRGAKIDLQNNNGWTALMLACRYDQPDMAQMLIEQGAKMNLQESKGWTALMFACRYEQPDTALALIERGAKLDLQDTEGGTALMYACCYSQPDTAQAIIQRGAKVNLRDNEGWTALMLASRYDQPDTAQALIQRGAKLDLQLTDGWTALMLSCQQPEESHHTAEGLLRSLKLCYAAGADLSLETVDGNDALAWARWFDRPDAVAFLEFATASEVAQIPRDALRQPQDLVVAFYEENLLTVEDCLMLEDEDLKGMGVTSPSKRRAILQRLNPSFAPPPRSSLPRRASHHMSKVMRGLSGADQNDACLATDWGSNGANHAFASSMENGRIRHAKRVTWFDKEGHDDDIDLQTSRGIGTSRKEVSFYHEPLHVQSAKQRQ